jgi:hypothetical protein
MNLKNSLAFICRLQTKEVKNERTCSFQRKSPLIYTFPDQYFDLYLDSVDSKRLGKVVSRRLQLSDRRESQKSEQKSKNNYKKSFA